MIQAVELEGEATDDTPAQRVSQLMRHRIGHYVAGRSDPSIYQSVRNMSQFVSDDYGNRFLIELIQNAHDAHDASRSDGEIAVVLDPSDGHGCLYVANKGAGFVEANLKGITSIALSSKPVNAGIGNKGLGFRSVLQVCNWPEIYSVDGQAGRGRFDGFCFRFATLADLLEHVPDRSERIAIEMERNLPCWHIPVPAVPGENVARFAAEGFATVVRLPLKSADALGAVRAQFKVLLNLKTPLQLFLGRVARISLDDGAGKPVVMERSVQARWTFKPSGFNADSPIHIEHLRLGDSQFVAAHWDTDERHFRQALDVSLDKAAIPETWRSWEGAAKVSVAVPLGDQLDSGTLYCFLPLGSEGRAPFAGYLNANFYTKMDRRSVDASIRLNGFFMEMAAWLSCQLIGFLVEENLPLSAGAVVSLLCWDDDYVDQVRHSLGDKGTGILKRRFLPVRGEADDMVWAAPNETYAWFGAPGGCLSPEQVCEVGKGVILVDSLSPGQRKALDKLYVRLRGKGFEPPPEVVATWVERIARQFHADSAPVERWAAFYDEVAAVMAHHASALFGKKFLLSANGELISSELPSTSTTGRSRRAADVYFSPVLSVDSDVDDDDSKSSLPLEKLPSTLRRGFALLSRDVPWLKEDGGHRPGRSFLIAGKLAREYDTRDVLRTLAGVTRSASADRIKEQALEWAFRLWNSGRSLSDKETRAANFHVPSAEGWIEAEVAMFGLGWELPNAKKLHALLRTAAEHSQEMKICAARLLLPYGSWPVRHGTQADWTIFLSAAGVVDCLRPIGGESVSEQVVDKPAGLPAAIVQRLVGLDDGMRAYLQEKIGAECLAGMYVSKQYRADLRSWRMPGQSEHAAFAPDVRRDYAVQIILALRLLTEEHLSFRAVRADTGAEVRRLSSPLYAFVAGANWLPVSRPGGQLRFLKPSQAWYFGAEDERPPRFMDFVNPHVGNALDATSLKWLQERTSLGNFSDERLASRVIAALTEAASSRIADVQDVRRFRELFERAWTGARKSGVPALVKHVPVSFGQEIAVFARDADVSATAGHFDDGQDVMKRQLLRELGEPVFDFIHGDADAAWNWVNASVPGRFRRISDEPTEVYVDGARFDDATPTFLLSEIVGSWIVDFLVCVAEHKSSAFVRPTQRTLGRVRRAAMTLSILRGKRVEFAHGEQRVPLPSSLRSALAVQRSAGAVLIVQTEEDQLDLQLLAGASGQLAVALGYRELAHGLDSALLRLAVAMQAGALDVPDDAVVATALGVASEEVRQTRRLASSDLAGLLLFAIPLCACIGEPSLTARLQELALRDDPPDEELRSALECLAEAAGIAMKSLEDRLTHLSDLSQLMDEFALPISRLNAVVEQLGSNYKKVSNEQRHQDAWARHLRQRQPAAAERLRLRAATTFDNGGLLAEYATAREEILAIPPDNQWFATLDRLDEEHMDARIGAWVDARLPESPPAVGLEVSLSEARTINGGRLREFLAKFAPLLSAWVRIPESSATSGVRNAWLNPESTGDAPVVQAKALGWLDFRLLDDAHIARRLTAMGMWPEGREPDPSPSAWGISTESVVTSEERSKAERAELQLRRLQVDFAGVTLSALAHSYAKLAAAVAEAAGGAPSLKHVLASDAELEALDPAKPGGGSGGRGARAPTKSLEAGMSDEQKLAVGLIGEAWAREWIRLRHGLEAVGENNWVSRYRDAVLNTVGGSDMHGYDFIVASKSRTYYYEVKASTGDPLRFELGPTELFAAQKYRADREHRYRVLYLANVGDPVRLRWMLLPNPFSEKASALFRPVGRGSVVYEFDPSSPTSARSHLRSE